MTLTRFADPEEHAKVLGPLYTSDMKCQLPPFGPDRFQSMKTKKLIASSMEKLIVSKIDTVVDYLALKQLLETTARRKRAATEAMTNGLREVNLKSGDRVAKSKVPLRVSRAISSRELHDKSHYSTRVKTRATKAESEQRDLVMLQRAVDGYLFNPKTNKAILADDKWLQDIWEWIFGKSLENPANAQLNTYYRCRSRRK